MDDNTLMQSVIDGNIDSLGNLFEKYREPLLSYFLKVTRGDQPAAEDLIQNVFHRILKYKNLYAGSGNFIGWLFSIARNCGIDYHRNKRYSYSMDEYADHSTDDKNAEETLLKKERINALYQALDQLESMDREVLILGKINELKYKDVADILDCSESAVRVRIFRAMQKLKSVYMKLEISER